MTSPLVAFIFLLWFILFWNKAKRGVPLDREERVLAWLGIIFIIVSLSFQILEWAGVTPSFLVPYLAAIVLGFAVVGLICITIIAFFVWIKRHIRHDARFKHLTVHYSSRKDSPKVMEPNSPRFIVNGDTKQAYWVSDLIEPYVRQNKIDWFTHDNLHELRVHFKKQNINENKRKPYPHELGLWIKPNGSLALIEPELKPEMLERLETCKRKGKLKNYEIAFLNPWYCWILRSQFFIRQAYPPNKRIIANLSTKEAFGAPYENLDIIKHNLISHNSYSPRPTEDISKWCKRKKGCTFKQRTLTVEELAEC
jgi:hypothetical protein